MTASVSVQEIITRLAQEVLDDGGPVASGLVEQVHAHAPGMSGHAALREETRRAGGGVVAQLAERLRDGVGMGDVPLPDSLVAYAHEFVRRGIEMEVLLGVVRVGYAEFARSWSARLQAADGPPEILLDALATSLLEIFAYVDALSSGLAVAYSAERERWSRSVEAIRADLVRSLLERRHIDVAATEQRLGHRLDGPQLAFVVWTDAPGIGGAGIALEAAARGFAARAGASGCLLVPTGGHIVSGWIAGADERILRSIIDHPDIAAAPELAVRGAIGTLRSGPEGFRTSHEQAGHARRVAQGSQAPVNTVLSYSDVALTALASTDLAHAAAFVEAELGALGKTDEGTRRIAATVGVYLAAGRNRARASRALGLHANTIAYRLGQAVELLGHELDERSAEVQVALMLAPLLASDG